MINLMFIIHSQSINSIHNLLINHFPQHSCMPETFHLSTKYFQDISLHHNSKLLIHHPTDQNNSNAMQKHVFLIGPLQNFYFNQLHQQRK
jgi:hypothetical protein